MIFHEVQVVVIGSMFSETPSVSAVTNTIAAVSVVVSTVVDRLQLTFVIQSYTTSSLLTIPNWEKSIKLFWLLLLHGEFRSVNTGVSIQSLKCSLSTISNCFRQSSFLVWMCVSGCMYVCMCIRVYTTPNAIPLQHRYIYRERVTVFSDSWYLWVKFLVKALLLWTFYWVWLCQKVNTQVSRISWIIWQGPW